MFGRAASRCCAHAGNTLADNTIHTNIFENLFNPMNFYIAVSANIAIPWIYSLLRLLTGFISAARMLWKLTVNNAMATDKTPASRNTHQRMSVW